MSQIKHIHIIQRLVDQNDYDQAKNQLENLTSAELNTLECLILRAKIALAFNDYHSAHTFLETAHAQRPESISVLQLLASSCISSRNFSDAMNWLKKALALDPRNIESLLMISGIFDITGNPTASEKTCKMILSINPNLSEAYNNLGNAYSNRADLVNATSAYEKALQLSPDSSTARANYLLSLNYSIENGKIIKEKHIQKASHWDVPSFKHSTDRPANHTIRLGIVSADLKVHSVSYFLIGLFENLSRERFSLYSYSKVERPDDLTKKFIHLSDSWCDIASLNSQDAANRIYADKIDILIDLAGHSSGGNSDIFGLTPCHTQISWLGYPATTGLHSMHYKFTDWDTDPDGASSQYSEKLYRLPSFLNYNPPESLPDLHFLDHKQDKQFVFGSFNNIAKLSPQTIHLWSSVLQSVPQSKLVIKHMHCNDPGVRNHFERSFSQHGVAKERLQFLHYSPTVIDHLQHYTTIDIGLDPIPYNGTTTTFEALMMGVPTLTLSGNVHASRVGATIMNGIGLPEFTATTHEDFVKKAIYFSHHGEELLSIKKSLRTLFYSSKFADSERFVRAFEEALLDIYTKRYTIV